MAMDGERWLTVAQAAALVQVHPETLREWLRAGRLPGTLLNRRAGWRIRAGDVERLLAGGIGPATGDQDDERTSVPADVIAGGV